MQQGGLCLRPIAWGDLAAAKPKCMADSNAISSDSQGGSSKLELPTQKLGSSVSLKSPLAASNGTASPPTPSGPLTEQPTAISSSPPIADPTSRQLASTIAQSLIGRDLMHFHVEQFVGGGGMGAVFRGRDLSLGRIVAIKVLSQDQIDEDTIRRFRHEAQSAAKLDHPAIPHVYYIGEQDGWYFIVFEFIEGENIRDFVAQQGPLSVRQSISYLADIAEALQHASSRNVVHRDIKPSNLLITHDGQAKLVDMGLARTGHVQSTHDELTATGVTLGTFDYISPEQARDPRDADIRSDIYSLGCTLYFMLTASPPFPEGTILQKLLSHTTDAPPNPSEFRSDVPEGLTHILARMLAKKPEHRFQDANELLADILLLASELNIPLHRNHHATVVVERPVVRETGWRRHIPWVVPLLLLIATAVALDPRWGWQAEPEQAPIPNGQVDPTGPELSREAIPERTPMPPPTNTADGD